MTAAEFAAVEPLLKISHERIKAARLALVDGMTYEGAAKVLALGWSRQAVGDCVRVVWREFEAYQAAVAAAQRSKGAIPEGWEQITLVAPKELIPEFYAQIAAAAPGSKVPKTAPAKKRKTTQPKGEA